MTIKTEKKKEISHPLIKSILLKRNIDALEVELRENINYRECCDELKCYLNQFFLKLIIETDVYFFQPSYRLGFIKTATGLIAEDNVNIREEVTMETTWEADDIYKKLLKGLVIVNQNKLLYERVYGILQHPNLVIQFMELYQLLLNLLSKEDEDKVQRNVINYFYKQKYSFVEFKTTRKSNSSFKEDSFTYLRNMIAHSELVDSIKLYKDAVEQVNNDVIRKLLMVINDVLMRPVD